MAGLLGLGMASMLHLLPVHTSDVAATDKWAHAAVSANLTVLALDVLVERRKTISVRDRVIASWLVWQVGLLKELTDPKVDLGDLKADVWGIAIGQCITLRF